MESYVNGTGGNAYLSWALPENKSTPTPAPIFVLNLDFHISDLPRVWKIWNSLFLEVWSSVCPHQSHPRVLLKMQIRGTQPRSITPHSRGCRLGVSAVLTSSLDDYHTHEKWDPPWWKWCHQTAQENLHNKTEQSKKPWDSKWGFFFLGGESCFFLLSSPLSDFVQKKYYFCGQK